MLNRNEGRTHPFPPFYLLVGVNERDVSQTAGVRVNRGGFGNEQCTRGSSPLSIILNAKVTVNVVFVGPNPCHWTENDAILEAHAADADGLKEFRHVHSESSGCRRRVSVERIKQLWGLFVGLIPDSLYVRGPRQFRSASQLQFTVSTII